MEEVVAVVMEVEEAKEVEVEMEVVAAAEVVAAEVVVEKIWMKSFWKQNKNIFFLFSLFSKIVKTVLPYFYLFFATQINFLFLFINKIK